MEKLDSLSKGLRLMIVLDSEALACVHSAKPLFQFLFNIVRWGNRYRCG
jgi:hypothetical protein